eukprot:CAMPEP_0170515818 /NCGR_PEP_ID=MMETSP0209-20121228/2220_1 /TAXON_ID=665100 ORGANISM="Litonotus pictus, Strain P1" /NCGR_SAMPLE_ID=MMETSP0209 /ASSEMBLY_ACC=CAM_ASM_000301 /LENGTH=480 /DNA_ID=CAMNT_0010800495 /DNA_START=189 /DNA_END=1632 /DNA_ORIENTATION=+
MNSEELIDKARVHISDFPMIFFFTVPGPKNLEDIYSRLELRVGYAFTSPERKFSFYFYRGMAECNPEHYTKHKDYVEMTLKQGKAQNLTAYCPHFEPEFILQNPYLFLDSASILVGIYDCDEQIKAIYNPTIKNKETLFPKCKKPDITNTKIYASLNYMNSFFDSKNYTHPVVYYPVTDVITLQDGSAVKLSMELQNAKVSTDVGWILEEENEIEVIMTKPTKELFNPSRKEKLQIELGVPLRRTNIIRNYLKLQELFAKIGGLFNAVNILCHILLYDYIRFKYRVHYSRFALTEEDFIEPEKKEIKDNMSLLKSQINIDLDLKDGGLKITKKEKKEIEEALKQSQAPKNKEPIASSAKFECKSVNESVFPINNKTSFSALQKYNSPSKDLAKEINRIERLNPNIQEKLVKEEEPEVKDLHPEINTNKVNNNNHSKLINSNMKNNSESKGDLKKVNDNPDINSGNNEKKLMNNFLDVPRA